MFLSFLIVDDDVGVAKTLARVFAPHSVVIADSLETAKALLRDQDFSGVVSDIGLPDGSGLDLVKWVRDRKQLPAVLMTGHVDHYRLYEAYELGVSVLLKPVSKEQIARFIDRVRDHHHPTDRISEVSRQWAERYDLSPAEETVLRLAAKGETRDSILEIRGIARGTLQKQVTNMLRGTGDTTLDAAVARLLREVLGVK